MANNPEFLISSSEDQQHGTFAVYSTDKKKKEYYSDDINLRFQGDGSAASLLFGWGIARAVALGEVGKQVLLLFHPQQEVSFPDNTNETE